MTGFAIMVLAPAALPHFGWFVATRLIAGALQGLFLAAAFTRPPRSSRRTGSAGRWPRSSPASPSRPSSVCRWGSSSDRLSAGAGHC